MFPQFSNPHSLTQAIEIVSRSALNGDDYKNSHDIAERTEMLVELEGLLKRSLGDLNAPTQDREHDARKKKRRRAEQASDDVPEPDPLPFRLISRALPPKPIRLQPKTPPIITVQEPPCEDDEAEAARRLSQAQAAAVDSAWVISESKKRDTPFKTDDSKKVIHLQARMPSPAEPVLMVAEMPKSAVRKPKLALTAAPSDIKPSPHALPTTPLCCPIVDVAVPSTKHKSKKRRKSKCKISKTRPPPMFWRPTRGMGGKSAGYAMGFEGSWPVYANDPHRYTYQRDTMRKGV